MIRSPLLIVWSILIGTMTADAQTFMKAYGSATIDEGAASVTESPDGNLFIGGYRGDSALVMKVDPMGGVVWARTFKPEPNYRDIVFQLTITSDGYLIGSGNATTAVGVPWEGLFYFKFDTNGNMIWTKRSTDTRLIYSRALLEQSQNNYILINDIYDTNSPSYPDILNQGVSASTGSITWTSFRLNYIPGSSIDDVYSGVMGNGGVFYTSGRVYVNPGSSSSMRPFISKFDANGNLIATTYYISNPTSSGRIYGVDIIYSNESLTLCYFGDINQYSSNFQIGLIHTDTLGGFIWGKNYDITNFSAEISFKVLKMPYGYVMTGYGTGGGNDLFALAVSEDGDLIWAKGFGSSVTTEDLPYVTSRNAIAVDGDIVFTGRTQSGGDEDVLLVRADENGEISCGESQDLSVITTDVPPYTASLSPTDLTDDILYQPVSTVATSVISDHCADPGPFLGNDTASCSPILLIAPSLGTGTTYLWQDGSTTANITANAPGAYWVQLSTGCCTFTDSVVVGAVSDATAAFSPILDPCSLSLSTMNISSGASSYAWDFGDGQTSADNQPTHAYSASGTYEITLTVTNACGSQDTTIQVQVLPLGSFSISGPDTLCADQEGAYTAALSSASLSNITWSSGADSSDIVFASSTSTLLYATATDTNNCSYSDTISIHINPGRIDLVGPPAICSDKPVEFHISYDGTGLHYVHWSTGDTTSTITTSPVDGEVIQVAAVDGLGCLLESSYVVQQIGDKGVGAAYIPNAFTPNKDGFNESFAPVIPQGFISMAIFDRWGEEIYETTEIHDPWRGDLKGVPVPDGTYVYIMKWDDQCTGEEESRIGSVTLLR